MSSPAGRVRRRVLRMDLLATVLHGRIADATNAVKNARAAGNLAAAENHTARLADLLALAAAHDVTLDLAAPRGEVSITS